ncbi:MAG: hypothetical protein Q8P91_00850 [bacterium]|nr:hypothetical protein [bacterium]
MGSEIPTKIKDVLFVATHPVLSLRTKARQLAVAAEHEAPPHTSTWEEFPELPLVVATKALVSAEKNLKGGVPKSAWSKTDQERMDRGERPLGYPEHPNI